MLSSMTGKAEYGKYHEKSQRNYDSDLQIWWMYLVKRGQEKLKKEKKADIESYVDF